MDKPLSVKRDDFIKSLIKSINESELPACVILDVLQLLSAQVNEVAIQQLQVDRDMWRKQALEDSRKE